MPSQYLLVMGKTARQLFVWTRGLLEKFQLHNRHPARHLLQRRTYSWNMFDSITTAGSKGNPWTSFSIYASLTNLRTIHHTIIHISIHPILTHNELNCICIIMTPKSPDHCWYHSICTVCALLRTLIYVDTAELPLSLLLIISTVHSNGPSLEYKPSITLNPIELATACSNTPLWDDICSSHVFRHPIPYGPMCKWFSP